MRLVRWDTTSGDELFECLNASCGYLAAYRAPMGQFEPPVGQPSEGWQPPVGWQLIDAWRRRAFALPMAPAQLEEVAEVLRRPKIARKYSIAPADQRALLELLRSEAILLPDERPPGICRDPDDDYLLGCAAAGGADHLVTGDADLLRVGQYRGMTIVDARQFLGLLPA